MNDCFLVLILPPTGDQAERLAELKRAKHALDAAGPNCTVVANEFIVCLLVEGAFETITVALDEALSRYTRSFVSRVAQPVEASCLSTIERWLASRLPSTER